MSITILRLLLLVEAWVIHETIHLLHYYWIKHSIPKIKFNLLGMFPQITDQLNISDKLTNIALAISIGFIPVLVSVDGIVNLAYLVTVIWDLMIAMNLVIMGVRYGFNKELKDVR